MVMRFFGGGVGHSQSPNQDSKDTVQLSGSESESESETELDIDVSIGDNDPGDSINSDEGEDVEEAGAEDSDNSSLGSGRVSDDLELESDDDGYDSL